MQRLIRMLLLLRATVCSQMKDIGYSRRKVCTSVLSYIFKFFPLRYAWIYFKIVFNLV